eukprot:scaffold4482_cov40-Phaeocystis_antarctica.AAC.2
MDRSLWAAAFDMDSRGSCSGYGQHAGSTRSSHALSGWAARAACSASSAAAIARESCPGRAGRGESPPRWRWARAAPNRALRSDRQTDRETHGLSRGRPHWSSGGQTHNYPSPNAARTRTQAAAKQGCALFAIYVMSFPVSIVASIRRCHRRDRGPIPRQEGFFARARAVGAN